MVLSFFFNSRILRTGSLQTGLKQFLENQKQNQDNTGPRYYETKILRDQDTTGRFGMKKFFAETSCSLALYGLLRGKSGKTILVQFARPNGAVWCNNLL